MNLFKLTPQKYLPPPTEFKTPGRPKYLTEEDVALVLELYVAGIGISRIAYWIYNITDQQLYQNLASWDVYVTDFVVYKENTH